MTIQGTIPNETTDGRNDDQVRKTVCRPRMHLSGMWFFKRLEPDSSPNALIGDQNRRGNDRIGGCPTYPIRVWGFGPRSHAPAWERIPAYGLPTGSWEPEVGHGSFPASNSFTPYRNKILTDKLLTDKLQSQ